MLRRISQRSTTEKEESRDFLAIGNRFRLLRYYDRPKRKPFRQAEREGAVLARPTKTNVSSENGNAPLSLSFSCVRSSIGLDSTDGDDDGRDDTCHPAQKKPSRR